MAVRIPTCAVVLVLVLSTFVALPGFFLVSLTGRTRVGILPPVDIAIPGFRIRSPDLFPFNCIFETLLLCFPIFFSFSSLVGFLLGRCLLGPGSPAEGASRLEKFGFGISSIRILEL